MKNTFSKKILPLAAGLLVAATVFAQDTATAVAENTAADHPMVWMYNNMFVVLAAVVILGALAALMYMSRLLFQLQKIRLLQEMGIEAMEEVKLMDKEPWWSKVSQWAWALKPMEQEQDIEFDHEYDGIRELDNVLPPWWVAMFYATIAFGVFYIGYTHFSDYGVSQAEEYEIELATAEKDVKAYLAKQTDLVDETNATLLTDAGDLAMGQSIFEVNCVACHGLAGEGNAVGPNLTDEYWLHGGGIKNVFKTIKNGVPEKGMIAWSAQLRASDIQRVSSYILSLQGTNPPNAKEPQGEIWKDENTTDEATEKPAGDEMSMQ